MIALLLTIVALMPVYRWFEIGLGPANVGVIDLVLLSVFVLMALDAVVHRRIRTWPSTAFGVACVVFVAAVLLSGIDAPDRSRVVVLALSLILKLQMVALVHAALRKHDDLVVVLQTYVYAAGFAAFVGILQGLDAFLSGTDLESISGTFEARNEFVFYLVPAVAFALGLAIAGHAPVVNSVIALSIFLAVTLSRGRAGFGLIVLVLLASLVLRLFGRGRAREGLRMVGLSIALLATTAGVLFTLNPDAMEYLTNRYAFSVLREFEGDFGSVYKRVLVLEGAWEAFKASPWIGIGGGNFKAISASVVDLSRAPGDVVQPHNTYLGVAVETGAVGLCAFLFVLGQAVPPWRFLRQVVHRGDAVTVSVVIAFVAVVLNLLTFDALPRYGLWLVVGLILTLQVRGAALAMDGTVSTSPEVRRR